jgi:hypothetical protein
VHLLLDAQGLLVRVLLHAQRLVMRLRSYAEGLLLLPLQLLRLSVRMPDALNRLPLRFSG